MSNLLTLPSTECVMCHNYFIPARRNYVRCNTCRQLLAVQRRERQAHRARQNQETGNR